MRKSARNSNLMVVIMFDGVNVAPHNRSRGTLRRETGGTNRDTEVRNLAIGNIVHESCVRGRSDEGRCNVHEERLPWTNTGLRGPLSLPALLRAAGLLPPFCSRLKASQC